MSNPYNFNKRAQVRKWEVFIDSQEQYGYFEHEDYGEGGSLKFENNELVDYDGVYSLPKSVIKAIEDCGFNADYAKD